MNKASRQAFLRSIPITLPDSWAFSGDDFRLNEQLTSYAVESNQTFRGLEILGMDRCVTGPIKSRWSSPQRFAHPSHWGSRDALANLPPQSNPPLAAWPRSRNVLGYEPWPQILNEAKSLYQSPSGTSGFDSIQTRSCLRSATLIARSRIRSIKCWRTPSGRLSQCSILGISR